MWFRVKVTVLGLGLQLERGLGAHVLSISGSMLYGSMMAQLAG